MQKDFTVAITGDSILNRRVSVVTDERFLALIKIVRDADVGFTHLETLVHDYEGPEIYPAAEAGWTWMRSPRFLPDELKWAGFDMISLASNHCLDYSYGGLYSTWNALDNAGLVHAGTGRTLGDARAPAYLETAKGRVALISMCSTFTAWARAGQTRPDVKGRPGLNPIRYYYVVDAETLDLVKKTAMKLGLWLRQDGKTWVVHPSGIQMATTKFVEGDQPGVTTVVDEDDADGNLRSIKEARRQADWVLVHLHSHEFDPQKGYLSPPTFLTSFARACVDAGADVFIGQGSHALLRGMELYKNKPIFYDPGDFFSMSPTVTRLPADYYLWQGFTGEVRSPKATVADAFDARSSAPKQVYPPGGIRAAKVLGSVVAVCSFAEDRKLTGIALHPLVHAVPRPQVGLPLMASEEMSRKVIDYFGELSAPFGTRMEFRDGVGVVKLGA